MGEEASDNVTIGAMLNDGTLLYARDCESIGIDREFKIFVTDEKVLFFVRLGFFIPVKIYTYGLDNSFLS